MSGSQRFLLILGLILLIGGIAAFFLTTSLFPFWLIGFSIVVNSIWIYRFREDKEAKKELGAQRVLELEEEKRQAKGEKKASYPHTPHKKKKRKKKR